MLHVRPLSSFAACHATPADSPLCLVPQHVIAARDPSQPLPEPRVADGDVQVMHQARVRRAAEVHGGGGRWTDARELVGRAASGGLYAHDGLCCCRRWRHRWRPELR